SLWRDLARHRRTTVVVYGVAANRFAGDRVARVRPADSRQGSQMISVLLFAIFVFMMMAGVPVGAALGLAGAAAIALANADSYWLGLLAVPQNFFAGLGKYPLLAIPMFVL